MNSSERGFTILEAMLAVIVLMVGVGALAKLNESMRKSVSPDAGGLLQHAEIVELLLRDAAETIRSGANPPLTEIALPALSMGGAVYTATIKPPSPLPPAVSGYRRLDYTVEVNYQAPGGAPALAGSLRLDAISPAASAGVRVGL